MDKHTFQVGDRVKSVGYANSHASGVELGVVNEVYTCGVEVNFDRKEVNRGGKDKWYLGYKEVQHDTDFQVGDWVRYEAVEPYTEGYDTEDGKVGQITHLGKEFATIKGELNEERFISNLVKIQPPQDESDNTIVHVFTSYTNKGEKNMRNVFNITHEKYGVVQGVRQVAPGCYCKNGAYYYHGEGWRETEEWVKIEVRKSQWETINTQIGTFEAWGLDDNCHTVSWRPVK